MLASVAGCGERARRAPPGDGKAAQPATTFEDEREATGSVTLSWRAPTTTADGKPLEELAGFRIRYGMAPGTYTEVIDIADPKARKYTVKNLRSGTWYFVVTAYDTNGAESPGSAEGKKTVMPVERRIQSDR